MKNIYLTLFFLGFTFLAVAQNEAATHLAEAKTNYASRDLDGTRFALQQSLNELYVLIGKKILAELPTTIGDAKALSEGDQYNGMALGYSSIYIDRTYQSDDKKKNINLSLINDSPMLGALNMFLSNPMLNMMSGKKMIKIDGYKCALEASESTPVTYTLYVPFSQSLLTLTFDGYDNENQVTTLAKQVPIGKIIALAE